MLAQAYPRTSLVLSLTVHVEGFGFRVSGLGFRVPVPFCCCCERSGWALAKQDCYSWEVGDCDPEIRQSQDDHYFALCGKTSSPTTTGFVQPNGWHKLGDYFVFDGLGSK